MPAFTVQNMVDRAVGYADMHDGFVTPQQWLDWFNEERRSLELFKSRYSSVLSNVQSVTVVGVDKYSFASASDREIMAVVGVWENVQGRFRPLRLVNWVDNLWQDEAGPITGKAQVVGVEDANADGVEVNTLLHFYPRDPSGTYLIMYLKAPAKLTAMTDSFTQPLGLEKRVVLGMARNALIKEESDISSIEALLKDHEKEVEQYVWQRTMMQGPAVRNTDRTNRGWMNIDEFIVPGSEHWIWV